MCRLQYLKLRGKVINYHLVVNSAHRLVHRRGLTGVKMARDMHREGPTVQIKQQFAPTDH